MNNLEFAVKTGHRTDQTTPLRWVWSHIRRQKWLIFILFIGAFGNAALAAQIPILIGRAFNAAQAIPAQLQIIGVIAVWIIIGQAVRAVLQLGRNFSASVIGERLEREAEG